MEKISLNAPAKINLYLNILGKRSDGFHEIESLMQAIDLYDKITLSKSNRIELICSDRSLPTDDRNLAVKAALLIQKESHFPGVRIELLKNIPVGAGLGGGSSDAAFVIRGLLQLFKLNIDQKKLFGLAAELGSDVPFFLTNGQVLARGRGEVLIPIQVTLDYHIIVVVPPMSISTAAVYGNTTIDLTELKVNPLLNKDISFPDLERLAAIFRNDLEKTVFFKYPELLEIKRSLLGTGAFYSSMSGSGSAFFGLYPHRTRSSTQFENLTNIGCRIVHCRPILVTPMNP